MDADDPGNTLLIGLAIGGAVITVLAAAAWFFRWSQL
jgi:hypothetical protein